MRLDTVTDPGAVRLLVAALVGPVRLIDNSAALAGADEPAQLLSLPTATAEVRNLERIG